MDNTKNNELRLRVNDAIRECAVAETSTHARRVMQNFFDSTADVDVDLMRCLLVELSVCMFHGFSKYAVDEEDATDVGNASPYARTNADTVNDKMLPPSKLGTIPLPSASPFDQPDENYKYDEFSDDSNAYSAYFDAESTTDADGQKHRSEHTRPSNQSDGPHPSTEEKWAEALNEDITRKQHTQSQTGSATCDDLFQALRSNASSVVLPKVPTAPSSASASVVSSDSSIPSQLPQSTVNDSPGSSLRSTPTRDLDDNEPPPRYNDDADTAEYDNDDDYEVDDNDEVHSRVSGSSVSTVDMVARLPEPDMIRVVSDITMESPCWDSVRRSRTDSGEDLLYGPRRLRNILESCIAQVLAQQKVENSSTPKKSHTSSRSVDEDDKEPIAFTVTVLKKMCRAISIELSLELRTPYSFSNSTSSSGGLNTSGMSMSSPVARDIGTLIWPVISAFVGASESDEMVSIIVDMLEAHILERKLFPSAEEGESTGLVDISTRSTTGSLPANDDFQAGLNDEPDEYASDASSQPERLARAQSISDQSVPGQSQADLVGQYIDAIAEEERHLVEDERSFQRQQKSPEKVVNIRQYSSPNDGDYEEDTAGSYSTSKSSQIKNREQHAWDMPKSPLDDIFRQTMGSMGSPLKLPPTGISYDINDSTSQGSSSEEERDVLEDYYDESPRRRGGGSGDGNDDEEEDDGEEETKSDRLARANMQAENYYSSSSASPSSSPYRSQLSTVSYTTSNAVIAGAMSPPSSEYSSSSHSDDESDGYSNEDDDDMSDEGSYDGYDGDDGDLGINVDDLPEDFGSAYLNGSHNAHHEPDAFDLDSLEEQLARTSPNSRVPGSQPSIDEILVAECLDNLIVLPKGETPLSSPDARDTRKSTRHKHGSQRASPDDVKGSPKFRERDPCTSSDEEDGDITDDEDTQQPSLITDAAVASMTGEILDALSDKDSGDDEENETSFDRNRHIPPSPYPQDPFGFQGQIPYPQDVIQLSPSLEECSDEEGFKVKKSPGNVRPEPSQVRPGKYDYEFDENSLSSGSSSGIYIDPIDEVEQQMASREAPPGSPAAKAGNLTITSMTSDDEREEDKRLFNDIMSSAPPEAQDGRSDVAYMSNLMRSTLTQSENVLDENDLINLISSNAIENVSNRLEDILYSRENDDDEDADVVERSRQQLENFEKRAAAYLASSNATAADVITVTNHPKGGNGHTDIRFDAMGLAVSGEDATEFDPTNFGDDNLPEFVAKALRDESRNVPVTGSDELNEEFTKSFRELMKYYSSESAVSSSQEQSSSSGHSTSQMKKAKKTTKKHKASSAGEGSTVQDSTPPPKKKSRRPSSAKSPASAAATKSSVARATPFKEKSSTTPLKSAAKTVSSTVTMEDRSKHVIPGAKVTLGGKQVYAECTDGPAMAMEWNETGNRSIIVPTAAPTRLRVRYTSNSATAAAAVEKDRKDRLKSAGASKSGRVVKVTHNRSQRQSGSQKQLLPSQSEVDLRAAYNQPSTTVLAAKKSRKKSSRSEQEKSLQRLSAPTFSSVARVLDTAGMDVGELTAIAIASKDAADMISAAASAGDSAPALIGSPVVTSARKKKSSHGNA